MLFVSALREAPNFSLRAVFNHAHLSGEDLLTYLNTSLNFNNSLGLKFEDMLCLRASRHKEHHPEVERKKVGPPLLLTPLSERGGGRSHTNTSLIQWPESGWQENLSLAYLFGTRRMRKLCRVDVDAAALSVQVDTPWQAPFTLVS